MGADLAFLLPMTFVIILIVILFIYLCTRNSRPKNLFVFNVAGAWGDIKFFFTGPARKVEVIDIVDEESGRTRSRRVVAVEEDTG
ncbi:hypothetical protein H072_357 [Dactylellina haptotyla CBS 200.50]|uniref:Uncharacterized protein n=1 Tax=Dactylellina haptotyla (strain CBS 200.50) TaxID=1284197 RepID=S8ARN6_DACHA|nr:hypothetical protein H072_357 [Dactylellina haptotyla CBS 200.50]